MRQGCTRCVGYLPRRIRQARNEDARVKLHEAKLCICSAWFLVHLPYLWTKERCVGVMYGQQILERGIKNFFLFLDLLFTSMFKGNSNSKNSFSMGPKILANNLFCYYYFKRENLEKRFLFNCSPFFFE